MRDDERDSSWAGLLQLVAAPVRSGMQLLCRFREAAFHSALPIPPALSMVFSEPD